MKNSKWLVVSYFANEKGMACSHHIDDRLPVLRQKGVDASLLTTLAVKKNRAVRHMRVPSISPSGIRFEVRSVLRKKNYPKWIYRAIVTLVLLPVFPFYAVEKAIINIDTTWFWAPLAVVRGYLYCWKHRPDVIYSTGGPISAHIAAAFIARWTGTKWIAEFQDPLIHSYCARSKAEFRLVLRSETFICRNAGKVVFLTEESMKRADERTGLGNRGAFIYSGATPERFPTVSYEGNGRLVFAHFGSLGGTRNLACFLDGLGDAIKEHPGLSEIVRIHLYGNVGKDIHLQIEQSGVRDLVVLRGQVPREQSLEQMGKSDVLLLIQGADDVSAETIPSKAYEYFHSRRPVLGLVYKNPELRRVLESLGHVAVEADKRKEIRDGLLHFVGRRRSGALGDPAEGSPFTVESAVERLIALATEAGEAHTESEGGSIAPGRSRELVAESGELNAVATWDEWFAEGGRWEKNGGRDRTRIFAEQFFRHTALGNMPHRTILDYRCGLGDSMPVFREAFPNAKLFGTDFSGVAIRRCRERFGGIATFFLPGEEDPEAKFDVLYVSNVLEHFVDYDGMARSLLARTRFLCVMVPYRETKEGRPLDEYSGGHRVRTLDETSFDFLVAEGLARRTNLKTFGCPGAWGYSRWKRWRYAVKNRIWPLFGKAGRPIPLQMLIEFERLG